MYEFFTYLSENFETICTIAGSVIVGASAACALVPGGGIVKRVLAVLALNVRNATPEQIAKGKEWTGKAAEVFKPVAKKEK